MTSFVLREEREILKCVLDLNIPFEVESFEKYNITWFKFSKSAFGKDSEPNEFKFSMISRNGMVNTEFDLDYLDDIIKWRNGEHFSKVFKLFLKE